MSIFVFNVASKCGLIWFAELHAKKTLLFLKKKVLTLVMAMKEGWKQKRIVNSVVFCFILNISKTKKNACFNNLNKISHLVEGTLFMIFKDPVRHFCPWKSSFYSDYLSHYF